jgi:sortase A
MRRMLRLTGTVLLTLGVLGLAWSIVVWRWQDPFTALYTHWQQGKLAHQYEHLQTDWQAPVRSTSTAATERTAIATDAAAYRKDTHTGQAIGRIIIGRLGLNMVLVDGTDESSLEKGPGRDPRTFMPGQNRLVYIAGHRTTFLAPFAHINDIRAGDYIRIEVPYGTFVYRAFRHEIVPSTAMQMLRSPKHELLRLQACHPRFFATHRYIVDARLVSVAPRDGRPYAVKAS